VRLIYIPELGNELGKQRNFNNNPFVRSYKGFHGWLSKTKTSFSIL